MTGEVSVWRRELIRFEMVVASANSVSGSKGEPAYAWRGWPRPTLATIC
jgi:hypothetical protein